MIVFKYILLAVVICLTLYLIVDTTVFVVKRVKQKKREKIDNQEENKDENKTE